MSYPPYGSGQPDPARQYKPPQQYAFQQGSHPGYPQMPPPPPKQGTKPWVWVVATLAGVFSLCLVLGALGNFAGDELPAAPAAGDQAEAAAVEPTKGKAPAKPKVVEKAKSAGIGDRVRDGKFEFVVTDLDCSRTRLGDRFLNKDAQGKFCVVTMSVKNIGDEAQMFSGSNQVAFDVKGAEFKNDGAAEFSANSSNETFLNDINPGNKVTGKVVFDVPRSTVLETIELHDSFWSRGVKVTLK
ncbi:MAG: DUF4352 domain-containing protein [Actinoplanes sp.]